VKKEPFLKKNSEIKSNIKNASDRQYQG
jgi:hypothetical protein